MATSTIKTYKKADPKEELLIDLDATIKEIELTIGTLSQIKQTILDSSNSFLIPFVPLYPISL